MIFAKKQVPALRLWPMPSRLGRLLAELRGLVAISPAHPQVTGLQSASPHDLLSALAARDAMRPALAAIGGRPHWVVLSGFMRVLGPI